MWILYPGTPFPQMSHLGFPDHTDAHEKGEEQPFQGPRPVERTFFGEKSLEFQGEVSNKKYTPEVYSFSQNHGSVENHPQWKVTTIGGSHFWLPWLWVEV